MKIWSDFTISPIFASRKNRDKMGEKYYFRKGIDVAIRSLRTFTNPMLSITYRYQIKHQYL
jgi:hypothetical protein